MYIPDAVYTEVVVETKLLQQRVAILTAIEQQILRVRKSTTEYRAKRKLDPGEVGVLRLALELNAQAIIVDDRKARNEATDLGVHLLYTTDILKGAERRGLIESYATVLAQLAEWKIYLPE